MDGFFFSSRRRHTRWTGDWSSDVCSSDLLALVYITNSILGMIPVPASWSPDHSGHLSLDMILGWIFAPFMYMAGVPWAEASTAGAFVGMRSEERRVGKECVLLCSPYRQ